MSNVENYTLNDASRPEESAKNLINEEGFTNQLSTQNLEAPATNTVMAWGSWVSNHIPDPKKILNDLEKQIPDPSRIIDDLKGKINNTKERAVSETKSQINKVMAPLNVPSQTELKDALKKTGNSEQKFVESALKQLEQKGYIEVGVLDKFEPNKRTHGTNVKERFQASLPDYLKQSVKVKEYNISYNPQKNTTLAIKDLDQNRLVGLSMSLGMPTVDLKELEQNAKSTLNDSNSQKSINSYVKVTKGSIEHQHLAKNMSMLQNTKGIIVTPILNDGKVAGGSLANNSIVTSIKEKNGNQTNRTEAPGLVDIEVNPIPGTTTTSQSAPVVLAGFFTLIPREQADNALKKYREKQK